MAEKTGQNRTELTASRDHAARLLAEGEKTDEEIAEEVGIARSTLSLWKLRPEIIARKNEYREEFLNRSLTEGFADKRERLRVLNMLGAGVLTELAKPGGFFREEVKIAANGEHVSYQVFDKPKHDTLRGYLDDIASEMGERKQVTELTGKNGEPAFKVYINVSPDEL